MVKDKQLIINCVHWSLLFPLDPESEEDLPVESRLEAGNVYFTYTLSFP